MKKIFLHKETTKTQKPEYYKENILFNIIKTNERKIIRICGIKIKIKKNGKLEDIIKNYIRYTKAAKIKIKKPIVFSSFPIEKIDVSIIIPVYNQFKYTIQCLNSIKQNTKDVNYEIIIIDDCSTDETKNLEQFVKNVKIIRNESNLGFLKNCNKAAKEAKGQYLYLLNNDTVILKDTIKELLNTFTEEKIGIAGSKMLCKNGVIQSAGAYIDNNGQSVSYGEYQLSDSPEYNTLKEVQYVSGASFMVRKHIWDKLGGFDEQFGLGYYEEADFCRRTKLLGFKVIYQPKSEIIHFGNKTFSLNSEVIKLCEKNRKLYLDKWKNK